MEETQNFEPSENNKDAWSNVAFEKVHGRFSSRLFIYIRYQGIDKENAEDILQDAWMSIISNWSKKGKFPNERSLWSYLHTVVKNKCTDFFRAKGRVSKRVTSLNEREHDIEASLYIDDDVHQRLHNQDEFRNILQSTKALSPRELRCICLSAQGKEFKEIAQIMGITVENVRTTISIGIKKCQAYVKAHPEIFQERGE